MRFAGLRLRGRCGSRCRLLSLRLHLRFRLGLRSGHGGHGGRRGGDDGRSSHQPADLHQRDFDEQAGIAALLVGGFAAGGDVERLEQEAGIAALGRLAVALGHGGGQFEQRGRSLVLADDQVAEMRAQAADETLGVEAFAENLVEGAQGGGVVAGEEVVGQLEVVFVVEDAEVLDHLVVGHFLAAEGDRLVEEGEGVAHRAVGLLGDDVHRVFAHRHALLRRDGLHVADHVGDADAVEVVGLAAGEDGGQDLVLLGGGQDEDGVCRGFLEGLEEGVEGLLRKHMHLVDDVDAVAADLGRDADLVGQGADVVDRVVGRGVELVDAVGTAFGEGTAGFALAARFKVGTGIAAVDGLGEDTGGARLADAARAAEQVGVGQLAPLDRVLERAGDIFLAQQRLEAARAVFPGRYDELFHSLQMYE